MDPRIEPRYRVGLLTLSDAGAAGQRDDRSGDALSARLEAEPGQPFVIAVRAILPDEVDAIAAQLAAWSDDLGLDLVVTTGGTGLGPRDVTPEATSRILASEVPGMAEAMRAAGLLRTPMAMLSRAVVGIRGRTLIANLPGSAKGALESLEALLPALPHALAVLRDSGADHPQHGQVR